MSIEIDFGPVGKVGKAIYLFYLTQNEGVSFEALKRGDYFDQLFKIYNRFFRFTEEKEEENHANLSREVSRTTLKNNLNKNLSTLVSRINKAFENELGPALGKDFGITGDVGGKRRIMVNREFITYSE